MKHCDTVRKYCIKNVAKDRKLLGKLYKRLGHFEEMTWAQAKSAARENAISIERKNDPNHKIMVVEYSSFSTFGHLRVNDNSKSKFRVFGALVDDLFYILRFDIDGEMNH